MEALVFLGDFAQVGDGKVNIIGCGWSLIGAASQARYALVMLLRIAKDDLGKKYSFRLTLHEHESSEQVVANGAPVAVFGEIDLTNIPIEEAYNKLDYFEFNMPFSLNMAPMNLKSSTSYEWRLHIAGRDYRHWLSRFMTKIDDSSKISL